MNVDILMTTPFMDYVVSGVDKAFRLHKLWEVADAEAVAEVAPLIRGIALDGETVVDAAFLSQFPKLEMISSMGVGYNHINTADVVHRGVIVTHTPGVLDEEVADTCLGLLLSTVREFPKCERFLRSGQWLKGEFPLTATLRGRTAGIFGLGRIGKAIARRLEAFGIDVCYHGRKPQPGVPYVYYPSLVDLAREVDILICVVPDSPETRRVVNAEVLEALGANGVLINIGRGSAVDDKALVDALRNKTILAAGLDVFANEPHVPSGYVDLENVVLFPHVGSGTVHTRNAMAQLVIDNLVDWFAGRGPRTPLPETPWKREA